MLGARRIRIVKCCCPLSLLYSPTQWNLPEGSIERNGECRESRHLSPEMGAQVPGRWEAGRVGVGRAGHVWGSVTIQEPWSAVWWQSCGDKDKVGATWEPPPAGPGVPLGSAPEGQGRNLGVRAFATAPSSLGVASPHYSPCLALFPVPAVPLWPVFSGTHQGM